MPGGMGKMELCYLASLLLCDKNILTQSGKGAEGQSFLFVIEMWWIIVVFVAKM